MATKKKKTTLYLSGIIILGLVVRIVLGLRLRDFHSDTGLFFEWAESIYKNGPGYLYENTNCDYPPGYMYVLWVLGMIIEWLKSIVAEYKWMVMVLKIPSIITDVLTGVLLYKIASEKQTQGKAMLIMCLYIFNPAVILNSSVWGQVDSILAFMVLLTVYFVYRKKMCLSYLSFCIGFFIKPQIIFIAPVILLGIIENVFVDSFSLKKLLKHLGCGLASILFCVVLCLPFNLLSVIVQYRDTISSFPLATMNAYNFWALLGLNYESQETEWLFNVPVYIWGYFFIICLCLMVAYLWFYFYKKRKSKQSFYYYLAALLIVGVFTLSVRMHERYMFPAMALLLAFCAIRFSAKDIALYIVASILIFVNVITIYIYYAYAVVVNYDVYEIIFGFATVAFCAYMVYRAFRVYKRK